MTNLASTPKLSAMKYRVVNALGTGAGSTILLISDKTAGGKRYALKVVRKQDPEDEIYVQQALTELMMQAIGPLAQPFAALDAVDSFDAFTAALAPRYCNYRKTTIYAGSNEIQRNIVAKRVLDL